ncbi:DUF4281 domain-containing protein [Fulvivirga sp. RKSG066]|uniref:ABA4-like family protein n=1 Tax=Fulvivirga aurantia TaxID=2529383 RepID=UPI0012BB9C3E|nr:ABA4-like family protein [Fulvivirga aurantia]MTI21161.1 DUF4281 domain-containing protein [Fulvivirga aurantia]
MPGTADIFKIVNAAVLPFWILLIFFPKKTWRNPAVYIFCVVMSILYVVYVVTGLGDFNPEAFNSLAGVKALFTQDEAVLGGWIHYLTFDLLMGNWIVNQGIKYKINHLLIVPCLFFCFMFGPFGYLLFSLLKLYQVKNLT